MNDPTKKPVPQKEENDKGLPGQSGAQAPAPEKNKQHYVQDPNTDDDATKKPLEPNNPQAESDTPTVGRKAPDKKAGGACNSVAQHPRPAAGSTFSPSRIHLPQGISDLTPRIHP